jgi:hypothetical protein
MTVPLTDAREELVDALEADLSVKIYPTAPPVPITPSVSVTCGSPWLTPSRLGRGVQVTWKVLVTVRDDAGHVPSLEALVWAVLGALPDGFTLDNGGPISSLDIGAQGSVMAVEILVSAQII